MNLFIMYMAGNTISIFPAMMVCMMGWRPLQALMSLSASEYHPTQQPPVDDCSQLSPLSHPQLSNSCPMYKWLSSLSSPAAVVLTFAPHVSLQRPSPCMSCVTLTPA